MINIRGDTSFQQMNWYVTSYGG